MNYLLQNRHKFYETVIPKIPDQSIRDRLMGIVETGRTDHLTHFAQFDHNKDLLILSLEDAVKKPNFGEKSGSTVVSIAEVLDRALMLEDLCFQAFGNLRDDESLQIVDSISFRIRELRILKDSLQYHRIRLL